MILDNKILDGKKLASKLKENIKQRVQNYKETLNKTPGIAVVLVEGDNSSSVYANSQIKYADSIGAKAFFHKLPKDISEQDLISLIKELNVNPEVDGIILQMPIPEHLNYINVVNSIEHKKDIEGLTFINAGHLFNGSKYCFVPGTPNSVLEILKTYGIEIFGKDIVIIGRSNTVGKPLAALLINYHATVTVCNSKTKNLFEKTKNADMVIIGIGKPLFLKRNMLKEGVVIIDIGINVVNGKIVGDVDFEDVKDISSQITPVPGGVGPVTVSKLFLNLLEAFKINKNINF